MANAANPRNYSMDRDKKPPKVRNQTKGEDYLVKLRKIKEDGYRTLNSNTLSNSASGSMRRNNSQHGNSRAILINGKEFIVRNTSGSKNSKKVCRIFNKLNSEKQKLKDIENEQLLLQDIDTAIDQFGEWIELEKNLIYLKIEEIRKGDMVKWKRYYITKEEYQIIHQQKCSLIMDVFSKKIITMV